MVGDEQGVYLRHDAFTPKLDPIEYTQVPGVQVLAVCDVYASKAERMKQHVERHYARARAQGTYKGCTSHQDFRELLAREDVDAVFIASPENWHGLHMGMAAKAGKTSTERSRSPTRSRRVGRWSMRSAATARSSRRARSNARTQSSAGRASWPAMVTWERFPRFTSV